jgi:hypothetical protein
MPTVRRRDARGRFASGGGSSKTKKSGIVGRMNTVRSKNKDWRKTFRLTNKKTLVGKLTRRQGGHS